MHVKISLDDDFPLNSSNHQLCPDFVIDNKTNLKYFSIEEFQKRLNVSESTVRRLISKLKNNKTERYFLLFQGKYYVSLNARNHSINCKEMRDSYTQYLKKYDWKIWGSVNFSESLNLNQIRKLASNYFENLQNKFPDESFTFFFVSEVNSSREGYHFHFLLDFTNEKTFGLVKGSSEVFFRRGRKNLSANTLIERFKSEKDGIRYILKQIKEVPDGYDVFLS